ncbi:serpin family protein [Nocardia brevicatena]|uniref:serpin family protein n=1 Tax=Nocardia brevicatena TaxID=37327 RepID=UPI0002EDA215|nr:serpin family protein [Nocardia brevicatena]
MRSTLDPGVDTANRLTGRWCELAGKQDFVLSGAGLWPLLGLLGAAARGPARVELEAAIGMPADTAHSAALRLLDTMNNAHDLSGALGVWVNRSLPLNSEWLGALPRGTVDLITDQAALDAWTDRHTQGLIRQFPLRVDPTTLLVLATALAVRTEWVEKFQETAMTPESGPWRGLHGPGLSRITSLYTDHTVAILDGPVPVTRVVVDGTADVDVHLLQGPGTPDQVLVTGLEALGGTIGARTDLPAGTVGPGLTVHEETAPRPQNLLRLRVPPFDIRSTYDFCRHSRLRELFGLRTAMNTGDHFPGISPKPLRIDAGAQDVVARFTRDGFEAAAITAFGLIAGAMPVRPTENRITVCTVTFDRPFGFAAVHRPTGLVLVAGWVATRPT